MKLSWWARSLLVGALAFVLAWVLTHLYAISAGGLGLEAAGIAVGLFVLSGMLGTVTMAILARQHRPAGIALMWTTMVAAGILFLLGV